MRRGLLTTFTLLLTLTLIPAVSQGAINVVDFSPRDITIDTTKTVTTGLSNVAVHTKVWLEAEGAADTNTVAWAVPLPLLIRWLSASAFMS